MNDLISRVQEYLGITPTKEVMLTFGGGILTKEEQESFDNILKYVDK